MGKRKATAKVASVALTVTKGPGALGPLANLAERAEGFARAARSSNTLRAYASDWRDFSTWCSSHRVLALPAEPASLALYIADQAAKVKASTLTRRLSAIAEAHKLAGHSSPTADARVRSVASGVRRTLGTAKRGRAPLSVEELRRMVATLPDALAGRRDRALLVLGFAGGLRRSELVGIDVEHVEQRRDGLVLTIGRSKTDQEGTGHQVGFPYGSHPETCPVRTFLDWRAASGVERGPLFRRVTRGVLGGRLSGRAVALIVKRTAAAAGIDPSRLAGHSLRSGFVTAAAEAGASERAIMAQTRHRSITVMRSYIRSASLFRENAAASLGL